MENKIGSNALKFVLIFCCGLILGVLGLIGYQGYVGYESGAGKVKEQLQESNVLEDDKESIKGEINTNAEMISYSEAAGQYSGISLDGNQDYSRILWLWENGTFRYEVSNIHSGVPFGVVGNYKIENEKINLNGFFEYGSDAGFNLIDESIVLNINSDMNFTGNFVDFDDNNIVKFNSSQKKPINSAENFNAIIKQQCDPNEECIWYSE